MSDGQKYGKWKPFVDNSELLLRRSHIHSITKGNDTSEIFILKERWDKDAFYKEVNALKELDHPNIEKLVDYNPDANPPYLVTEYCKGGNMKNLSFRDWPISERLNFFTQICNAVEHIHKQGIIKSDHKPGNIFLKADGKTPVIGDFNLVERIPNNKTVNIGSIAQSLFRRIVGKDFMRAIARPIYILLDEAGNVITADDTVLNIVDRYSETLPPFRKVDKQLRQAIGKANHEAIINGRYEAIITGKDGSAYRLIECRDNLR